MGGFKDLYHDKKGGFAVFMFDVFVLCHLFIFMSGFVFIYSAIVFKSTK